MTDSHGGLGAESLSPPTGILCDWCDEPRQRAVDRMEVSNGASDILLHLDLCADHAAELTNGGLKKKILKVEKVQRIKASMM